MVNELRINGVSALEMTMRDVLDGMEELSTARGFSTSLADLEILAIEPPSECQQPRRPLPFAAA